jgi:hypothetical protein
MAIRHSILRSSIPLLCSLAAVALAFGCSSEEGNGQGDDDETAGTSTSGGKGGSGGAAAPAGAGTGGATGGTPGSGGKAAMTGGYAGTTAGTSAAGGSPGAGTGGATGGAPIVAGGAGGMPGGAGGSTGGSPAGGSPAGGSDSGTGGGAGTGGQAGGGAGNPYNPDFEEFTGEDCEVAEPADVNDAALPDLFESLDGTRITQKSHWSCRRAELKKIVEKYIHGEKPGKPEMVSGTVTATSVTVQVQHMGKSAEFSVSVSIPSGAKRPAPAIIGLGGGSLDRSILTEEGVATMNYNNGQISSETSRSGIFSNVYGNTGASAQVGWAWGVSRIIDVLIAEKEAGRNDLIDPTAIGVTGCSRLGKGAFTIGAFDERIALGIPQESGTGGVSAFRVVNTNPMGPNGKPAQSLASAWTEAQGWFGTAFGNYRNNVNVIPGDTHSLVAMYAPRGLLVLDNSRIGELGSSAQHAASAAGARVYAALGVEKNIAYHGGRAMDPHMHCSFYSEQAEPLRRAIRAHLTRTAEPAGAIEPQPAGTADLARWIDWDTPVLE